MYKNNYIQNKSLRTFLTASVLISVMSQVNTFIDGIIVNHFISPDALSAVSLVSPLMFIMYIFFDMVSRGASILVVGEMGMQHYKEVPKYMTSSMLITFMVTGVMTFGVYVCSDTVARMLTTDSRLLPLLLDYLPVVLCGSIVTVVYNLIMKFAKWIGRPDLSTKTIIVVCLSNILLDIIFVGVMSMGMKGAAWATNVSVVIGFLYLAVLLQKKDTVAKIIKPRNSWLVDYSKRMISYGFPTAIGSVSTSVLLATMNYLVLKTQGADGMFVLSVSLQVLIISNLIFGSASSAITNIGGMMLGEGDVDGYRSFMTGVMRKVAAVIGIVTLAILVYPDMICYIFDATDEMREMSRQPFRAMVINLFPFAMVRMFSANFQQQGHRMLCTVIMSMYVVCMIPFISIGAFFLPRYLWYSFALGFWSVFLLMVCCTIYISRRNRELHWFTLIPMLPNDPSLSLSVRYDSAAVQDALLKVHQFLDICDLEHEMYYRIDTCIEEITCNIIAMTKDTGKEGTFDIRVVDDGKKILVAVKDDGKPFNPTVRYNAEGEVETEGSNISMAMINSMCPDFKYRFINGINCVYMNFPYIKE